MITAVTFTDAIVVRIWDRKELLLDFLEWQRDVEIFPMDGFSSTNGRGGGIFLFHAAWGSTLEKFFEDWSHEHPPSPAEVQAKLWALPGLGVEVG